MLVVAAAEKGGEGRGDMTHYLINLDRASDRLAFQRAQFDRLGLSFERVPACSDDAAAVGRFRWWCAMLRPVVRGEIGCALSHVKALRLMLARREDCAAVFEDDVRLSARAGEALAIAEEACRRDPRLVVLLGDHRRTKCGEPLVSDADDLTLADESWDFCSEGYVIGREAAARIAKVQSPVRRVWDSWGAYRKKGWIRLMRVVPPVCGQAVDECDSSLGSRYVAEDHGWAERIWWKLRRVVGVTLDGLMDGGRFGW